VSPAKRSAYRTDHDSLGEVRVPKGAYYGAQTARAVENFSISPLRFGRRFVRALGQVKYAAAQTNIELGQLAERIGKAVLEAAQEVIDGKHDDQFVVDVFQTGSGTSTNMNANEVIANRASELLGGERGDDSLVHPNDHVNRGQSTNDTFPTTIHVAALDAITSELTPALAALAESLEAKATDFADVVKAARTHLQDAVPITLGQELSGYASVARHGAVRVEKAAASLAELPIGGTAVGTGLNAHSEYAGRVVAALARLTGLPLKEADNRFEAMQNRDACVEASGALKVIAVGLMKLGNDLRLLASGPATGLGEIELPAVQPGSSIMPGKVNPVIPEAVNMVAARVIGNDASITVAGLNGNLDLNVMMPLIAHDLLESIELVAAACRALATDCIAGMTANLEACRRHAESSVAIVTALVPELGYDKAAAIAKRALAEGKTVRQVVLEDELMPEERLAEILDPARMARGSS
jgi:fumarate hydratase class II